MEVRNFKKLSDVGQVLFAGFGDFDVIVVNSPGPIADTVICYGVFNKATGIVEAYTNSYAKAKFIVRESDLDNKQGYDRPSAMAGSNLPSSLQALLTGGRSDDDVPPGKAH